MNQLLQLNKFEDILNEYQISQHSSSVLRGTKLVLLAAITSSGRNTIVRELTEHLNYHYIVSDTTRKPRVNDGVEEQNGVEYWFKSEDEFLRGLRNGEYLEAAIIHQQQVSGISIKELERAKQAGKIPVTDIEVQGVDSIVELKPDTICIFVLPPSFDEWQRRLKHRGHMTNAEFIRRLQSAVEELSAALRKGYYKFVINDTVENAMQHIKLLEKGSIDAAYQESARSLTERLLQSIIGLLNTSKVTQLTDKEK